MTTTQTHSLSSQERATTSSGTLVGARPHRFAGIAALSGVALAVIGSVLNQGIAGVDIFAAMETGSSVERARLLTEVADAQAPLVAGFVVWMLAFPLAALASVLLARLGRQSATTDLIRHVAVGSIGAIVMFLSMYITFVTVIAPAHVAGDDVLTLAHTIGFTAATIDWVVTAVVLGFAPIGAVYAGRDTWAPRWLHVLAFVAALAAIAMVVGLLADARALTFPIVPIGLVLLASAGICAIRYADN